MRHELTALVVHDLKNALGVLEAELLTLERQPRRALAAQAHAHCAELRQRFVMFLTAYGIDGKVRAQPNDESPVDLLQGLQAGAGWHGEQAVRVALGRCAAAPAFWYFDRRLVHMALQAALHNAQRFGRREVVLDARQDGGFLVLSIDDDGAGLGAADPSQHATGLGTELCRAVAGAHCHEGRSGCTTLANRPDGGVRFELWLP